tara:strand:+ start:846 stop:1040 length:195 start_codon:yes stop_codon:yes gene_type:complete
MSQSEIMLVVFADVNFKGLAFSDRILVSKLSIGVANIRKTKKNAVFVFVSLSGIGFGEEYTLKI